MDRAHAEVIVTSQQLVKETRAAVNELLQLAKRQQRPAQLRELQLQQGTPKAWDEAGDTALSIGFYNPTGLRVFTTINGGAPEPGRDSLAIPAQSFVVLPVTVQDIAIGADPADPQLPAAPAWVTIYVLRFDTVQAPFAGRLA